MRIVLSGFCGLLLALVLSCASSRKTSQVSHQTLETVTVSAKNNPLDLYRASEPRHWDITHTRAALSFDFDERIAHGRAWLRLHPYWYATDSLVLDAKSMSIDSVMLHSGASYQPVRFSYGGDKLLVHFDKTYSRDESVELYIRYTARPYAGATGGSKAITDDRGLYFINTRHEVPNKPVQIWTQGETESNSHWLPTLDQPSERTTVQLELTVPDSLKTLSNGALLRREMAGKGLRTDVWAIQQPIQVYAIMFAIGNFSIVEDRTVNGVKVSYYVEPEYAPYAKKMFNHTPEMIEYFSRITGVAYPWNKYSQVVVRDYVSGAMENTTASLFGEFMNQNFREIADKNYEDIVSHELFHQWFGDYVTAESWSNLTVNESFANYGEQLWRSYKYGKASNDELAYNDLAKYMGQTQYNDEPLVRFHYAAREDMFDRISYEKGGATLRYLHGLIGDDAFYKAMQLYLTKNALQPAEAHHWRLAVEEVTGKDWNWFFDQWYYRGGHPELSITYNYDDKNALLKVSARQTASDSGLAYDLPLKAALYYGNQPEVIDWRINGKKQEFSFPYRSGMKPLFVPDQEHWLVGTIKENKTPAHWLQQLQLSGDYINKRRAVSGAFQAQGDTAAQTVFRIALRDSLEGIRTHALSLLTRVTDRNKWQQRLKEEVSHLAMDGRSNRVRAAAFDVLGKWKITAMKPQMMEALTDSSYLVAGSALEALQLIDKDTAYVLARRILNQDPRATLESAAWSAVALKGAADDIALLRQKADYVYGTRKIVFANYVHLYNLNTSSLSSYEAGLTLIAGLADRESIKSYRFAIGSLVFASANYYKDQAKSASTPEKRKDMEERMAIAVRYRDEILKAETDPENLERYKSL